MGGKFLPLAGFFLGSAFDSILRYLILFTIISNSDGFNSNVGAFYFAISITSTLPIFVTQGIFRSAFLAKETKFKKALEMRENILPYYLKTNGPSLFVLSIIYIFILLFCNPFLKFDTNLYFSLFFLFCCLIGYHFFNSWLNTIVALRGLDVIQSIFIISLRLLLVCSLFFVSRINFEASILIIIYGVTSLVFITCTTLILFTGSTRIYSGHFNISYFKETRYNHFFKMFKFLQIPALTATINFFSSGSSEIFFQWLFFASVLFSVIGPWIEFSIHTLVKDNSFEPFFSKLIISIARMLFKTKIQFMALIFGGTVLIVALVYLTKTIGFAFGLVEVLGLFFFSLARAVLTIFDVLNENNSSKLYLFGVQIGILLVLMFGWTLFVNSVELISAVVIGIWSCVVFRACAYSFIASTRKI